MVKAKSAHVSHVGFSRKFMKQLKAVAQKPAFAKSYAVASLAVLLATTVFWSLLGARLQQSNSDQLVNPYLFQNSTTTHGAQLPGAHTQLLKWPLFWLVKLFGLSAFAFGFWTVAVTLVTVGGLAFVLYRIERRPLVFGTLCLALSSVLLLIPAQPYPGGLLPVNLAMLSTRNVEYLVYTAGLVLLTRAPRRISWQFGLGSICLGLLIASDKLFLALSLGGAALALVIYALRNSWRMVSLAVSWLLGGVLAAVVGLVILGLVQASGLLHIVGQSTTNPYGVIHGAHSLVLGIIYAIMGLFTNFGANPAYSATTVRGIPHQLVSGLFSPAGPTYLVNIALLLGAVWAAWQLLRPGLIDQKSSNKQPVDATSRLSVMLLWTAVAAIGIFVVSNHYYAVDARYLAITFFALFVSLASYSRRRHFQTQQLVCGGVVLLVAVLLGLVGANHNYHQDQAALASIQKRDVAISQVLTYHPVQVLVGDYWRVLPTKFVSQYSLNVLPLANCTQARDTLSSQAWQPDLHNHSFAYLLSLSHGLTDYPTCSLQQIVTAYGRPNASTVIAGSLSNPQELLLFYDHGIRPAPKQTQASNHAPATVVPIAPSALSGAVCDEPTVMNIVAHQDDDLLFMNPDLLHDIVVGHCVRTIYITAGDAGNGRFYWLSRQQGSEAAYDSMLGLTPTTTWVQRIVQLAAHEYVTIANPQGNSKVSLIFMYLPDGNLKGQGFSASHFESLASLEAGKIKVMQTVDGQSSYTESQLTTALITLMHTYQPTEIRTQANYVSKVYPDHSDHMAVGRLVKQAYQKYETEQYGGAVVIPLKFYVGYPVHAWPANVSGADLQAKEAAFLAYAKFDGSVCQSPAQCASTPTYGSYLTREYQNAY